MTVASNVVPFNPLERKHLGASVAQAMLAQTPQPFAALPRFEGAGIYAIYYTGPLACYAALSAANRGEKFALPIYVGKAVPEGARIGGGMGAAGFDLHKRLREHAKSVAQAENLDAADFFCRYLVVEDIWIPLGESLLIAKFAPIWNTTVTGFGNHVTVHDHERLISQKMLRRANRRANAAQLVNLRYRRSLDFGQIAAQLGRTVEATRQQLARIRLVLRDCIQKELARP